MPASHALGVIACLVATLSWGGMFPVMADAMRHVDPYTLTTLRYSLAGLVFAALLWWREGRAAFRLRGERWRLAWALGSAGFTGFGFLVFCGQRMLGAAGVLNASIMMATMPLMSLLVAWALWKRRPPLVSVGFVALAFAGVLLVVTRGEPARLLAADGPWLANPLLLAGALCWVGYTLGATAFAGWSPLRYTALTTLLGTTTLIAAELLLIATGAIARPRLAALGETLPHLGYVTLLGGVVAVLAWNTGLAVISPLNGVLFINLVPVTAFTVSTLMGVPPAPAQVAGAALTMAALVANNLAQRRMAWAAARRAGAAGSIGSAGSAGAAGAAAPSAQAATARSSSGSAQLARTASISAASRGESAPCRG
ncbi:DMT family transporter [Derxia gummosa]|uniref:DMT family transporter n=1 Tax=Derxia gummosa DSM 723 TaxID=1121388 RepID=A0A8B6XB54_9BURK|nr:DMT family transporter [Derxia gummosa]